MVSVKKVCRLVKSKPKKKQISKAATMSMGASRPDPFSGGPIPLKNKRASYFMTSGRNPILQIQPSTFTMGSFPSVASFQTFPSTLDSEANAIQTFLGQRQSRVMDGGQSKRKPASTSIGSSFSATRSQSTAGNIKVDGYDSGSLNSVNKNQNAFLTPIKPRSYSVPELRDVVTSDKSGDSISPSESGMMQAAMMQAAYDALPLPTVNSSPSLNQIDAYNRAAAKPSQIPVYKKREIKLRNPYTPSS
jgi:hypothetical protein